MKLRAVVGSAPDMSNIDHAVIRFGAYEQPGAPERQAVGGGLRADAASMNRNVLKSMESVMLIEVRTSGKIAGSEQLSAQVTAVMHAALDRFGDHIRRVDVHLGDEVHSKAGFDDNSCMIEVHRDGHAPIVAKHHGATTDQAIHGAVHDLKRSVESALGKESLS